MNFIDGLINNLRNKLIDYKTLVDRVYMVSWIIYFTHVFLLTTMFPFDLPRAVSLLSIVGAFVASMYRILYISKREWRDICLIFLMLTAAVGNMIVLCQRYLIYFTFMVIGAKDVSFKRIVKLTLIVGICIMLATVAASQLGIIEDLVYNSRGGHHAHALGICFTTDFAAHVLFLLLGYGYLREAKFNNIEYVCLISLAFILFKFTRARNDSICIVLFIAATFLYHYVLINPRFNIAETLRKIAVFTCIAGIAICITLTIVLTIKYPIDNRMFAAIDEVLGGRFRMGHQAYLDYGITLFGSDIPQMGYGGNTNYQGWYFFLDCSYVAILFCKGITAFICMIWIECKCIAKSLKDNIYLLIILAIIALQCVFEHHWQELAYNIFVLMTFANIQVRNEDEHVIDMNLSK